MGSHRLRGDGPTKVRCIAMVAAMPNPSTVATKNSPAKLLLQRRLKPCPPLAQDFPGRRRRTEDRDFLLGEVGLLRSWRIGKRIRPGLRRVDLSGVRIGIRYRWAVREWIRAGTGLGSWGIDRVRSGL